MGESSEFHTDSFGDVLKKGKRAKHRVASNLHLTAALMKV